MRERKAERDRSAFAALAGDLPGDTSSSVDRSTHRICSPSEARSMCAMFAEFATKGNAVGVLGV